MVVFLAWISFTMFKVLIKVLIRIQFVVEDMYYENDNIIDLILSKIIDILDKIIKKIKID
jgi:hypothetical protein